MKKYIALSFICASLSACASHNSYQEPAMEEPGVATLDSFHSRDGLFTWASQSIQSIDNQRVQSFSSKIAIKPGQHKVTLYTMFNEGFGGACPCESFSDVHAKFSPNREYLTGMQVNGAEIRSWIYDAKTGEKVSNIASSRYQSKPRNNGGIIFVPAGKKR